MIFPVIIFETLWHISGGLHTDGIITIGSIGIIIFFVLMTIYGIKAVVGIHRFIILNENYSEIKYANLDHLYGVLYYIIDKQVISRSK